MRIKICGVTTPADAELVAQLGTDLIGLNFYPRSPRFIDRERAKAILAILAPAIEVAGVFVNPTAAELESVTAGTSLPTVQLHASDPVALEEVLGTNGWRVILAHGVGDRPDVAALPALLASWSRAGMAPVALLVDARVEGLHGGTGQTAPWELLADFQPGVPLILAGGLTPDNVAEAIRIVRPAAVDVASGVERFPGVKDAAKLRRFIDNARAAAARYGV